MAQGDRIEPICDLLMGAAYADKELKDREREEVREMLADLSGSKLTTELEDRIKNFDPKAFDLDKTAAAFKSDTEDERRRLLFLVAAINDADEEVDFAEDEYLRSLAKALDLPASALAGMTIDVEVEELREDFQKVRKGPAAAAHQEGRVRRRRYRLSATGWSRTTSLDFGNPSRIRTRRRSLRALARNRTEVCVGCSHVPFLLGDECRSVDSTGIEPASQLCESRILPLEYEPIGDPCRN
jgi:uncharacterized tellurite resistance protein B-like protein